MAPSLLQHPLVLIATTFIVGIPVLFVAAWAGVLFSPLIIAGLLSATLAPNPPHAYRFFDWEWVDRDWRKSLVAATTTTATTTRGGGNGGSSSSSSSIWSCYWRRAFERCHFALQLLIAGTAGFTHAFFASLVPFVAEEVGAELFALVTARRKKLKVVVVKEGGGGKGKGGGGQAVIDFEAEVRVAFVCYPCYVCLRVSIATCVTCVLFSFDIGVLVITFVWMERARKCIEVSAICVTTPAAAMPAAPLATL
jgi:hypothetical protein